MDTDFRRALIRGVSMEAGSGLSADEGWAEAERVLATLRKAFPAGSGHHHRARAGDPDTKSLRSRSVRRVRRVPPRPDRGGGVLDRDNRV